MGKFRGDCRNIYVKVPSADNEKLDEKIEISKGDRKRNISEHTVDIQSGLLKETITSPVTY